MINTEMKENMQFVMMDTAVFDEIINQVITTVKMKMKTKPVDWIDEAKAKELLGVSSKSTMQRFRDEDRIIYSTVTKKNIMYSKSSILRYMEGKSNTQYV